MSSLILPPSNGASVTGVPRASSVVAFTEAAFLAAARQDLEDELEHTVAPVEAMMSDTVRPGKRV